MAGEQIVSASDILKAAGADKPVTKGTFLQRTGLVLAASVGATGAIVTLALVVKWVCYAPALPVIQPGADVATTKAALDNFKTLQQVALEPLTTLFDSIVVTVILPVFTSILGYIFGSKANEKES